MQRDAVRSALSDVRMQSRYVKRDSYTCNELFGQRNYSPVTYELSLKIAPA